MEEASTPTSGNGGSGPASRPGVSGANSKLFSDAAGLFESGGKALGSLAGLAVFVFVIGGC